MYYPLLNIWKFYRPPLLLPGLWTGLLRLPACLSMMYHFAAFFISTLTVMRAYQWRIHVGVHGGRDPPFESPIFSICTKRPFCRFFNFFSTPNIKEVMPVFAPKSEVLHHCFQKKNSGWNKCTQNAGKMHHFAYRFWKFSEGDTPEPFQVSYRLF